MLASEPHIIISTIGWALIHFLWQGTLITFAYWVITRSIESIHAKYWTGMALVVVSLLVPLISGGGLSSGQDSAMVALAAPTQMIPAQHLNWESVIFHLVNTSLPYLVLLWAIVVVFLSARLIKSWIHLAAITHECEPQTSRELKQIIKNAAIKLDLPNIPLLKVSHEVLVPAAYGVFKPTVLLPLSLISQIPGDQLEAIIKHELCHLKRNDFIHNIIQLCADILFFFHPGIRWMNNDIRHVREQCCDQMVLAQKTEALTYAKALTNIASYTNGLKLSHSVHLGANDGVLLKRVKILLQNNSSQSSLMVFMPLLLLIMFIALIFQPAKDHDTMLNTLVNQETILQQNQQTRRVPGYPILFPKLAEKEQTNTQSTETSRTVVENPTPVPVSQQTVTYQPVIFESEQTLPLVSETLFNESLAELNNDLIPDTFKSEAIDTSPIPSNELILDETLTETTGTQTQEPIELNSFVETGAIKPQFKKYHAPAYPQHFWLNQVEQDVIATFKIQPNGRVIDIQLSSQGNNFVAFEQEVTRAMRKWRFESDSLNASTLQQTYQQIFSFAISDEVTKNCQIQATGSRMKKSMPCNK